MLKKDNTHVGHIINDSGKGGAQGFVHRATRLKDNKELALKLMRLDPSQPTLYRRFKLENIILHKLKPHTNIVTPYSNVNHDGTHAHYSMEYIEEDLNTLIDTLRGTEITVQDKIELIKDICRGLQHAHDNHIYHRDLHPGNVRVALKSRRIAKLADFGLGKFIGSNLHSETPLIIWGADVRPPEAMLLTEDTPSETYYRVGDIYALGITMHWIFTPNTVSYVYGIRADYQTFLLKNGITDPLDKALLRNTFSESERRVMFDRWLKQLNPYYGSLMRIELPEVDIAKKLTQIINKMCSLNPADRYQTVGPIIDALESL